MSTSLNILRQNGNVPKTLQGEDHISGIMAYLPSTEVPDSFKTERVQPLSTIEAAEAAGITADAASWGVRVLHYHLSEIYRLNPAVILYVGGYACGRLHICRGQDHAELCRRQAPPVGCVGR